MCRLSPSSERQNLPAFLVSLMIRSQGTAAGTVAAAGGAAAGTGSAAAGTVAAAGPVAAGTAAAAAHVAVVHCDLKDSKYLMKTCMMR